MGLDEWMDLVLRNAQEVVTREELEALYERPGKRGYIGFEPSGMAHIGWLIQAAKVRDLQQAGFHMIIYLADWHAFINDKFGGDMEKIRTCARYMEDCFLALGVDPEKAEFLYASELLDGMDYWEKVLRISKKTSLQRMKRALTIMGRKEEESEMDSSKLIYPSMQAADIFQMDLDLALGGMDQRKAHMLARDAAEKLGWKKFVALHTPLLPGLQGGERMDPLEAKMSKSDPNAALFIHDTPEEINRKLKKAYCPQGQVDDNPVLEMARLVVFPLSGGLHIERPEKFGGPLDVADYMELESMFGAGRLHPLDLKKAVARSLADVLEPVRDYFSRHPGNLEAVRRFAVTG
ncbi:MAG: tyrosine--tRNA ligase [Thermoplasmata archaeon]|nr:tyrosine--tRNA ligase [Thermoplasmata archaeon]